MDSSAKASRKRVALVALGALAVLALGCVACGLGARALVFQHTSEVVFEAQCDGEPLQIVYEQDEVLGDSTNRRAFGTWRGAEFRIDAGDLPKHLRAWPASDRPAPVVHESGSGEYVHFFLGEITGSRRSTLERCIEANEGAILSGLDRMDLVLYPRTLEGRGRAYWGGGPSDLVPTFTHGGRTIELRRDGQIWLRRRAGGSSVGFVEARPDHSIELRCCERHVDIDAATLAQFVDDEGQSLPDRLGVPVTSCAVPGRSYVACRR